MGGGVAKISKPSMLAALVLLFALAGVIGGPANAFDRALIEHAAVLRESYPGFTRFAAGFTELGGAAVTISLAVLAALSLFLRGYSGAALLLAGAAIGERLMVEPLKEWIARPRPAVEPLWLMPQNFAYPSGHAANAAAAFVGVALFAIPGRFRWAVTVAAFVLAFLVGCSRIYLGVHWPSDVVAGWALGLLCVGVAACIGERSGALPFEPQHDVVGRHRLAVDEQESA
jgi:undecaprenyl-diphosphatase